MGGDLERIAQINFDRWTETWGSNFYLTYLTQWPECCVVAETANGCLAGYLIAKVEGEGVLWHSHISALSIAVEFRRTGVARKLMEYLEELSGPKVFDCYFVDLFVRGSNRTALAFYEDIGYTTFRTVVGYYSGEEDAFDMRKCCLSKDSTRQSIAGAGRRVTPDELEW